MHHDPAFAQALQRYAEECNAHPSLQMLGARIAFPDPARIQVRVEPVSSALRGGLGDPAVVNGGVLSALCDLLIGCTSALVDPAGRAATVQLSIHFERALRGDLILGEAHIDRSTARLIFASGVLRDGAGDVCVRCQGLVHRLAARAGS